jgi:hypothetical protein
MDIFPHTTESGTLDGIGSIGLQFLVITGHDTPVSIPDGAFHCSLHVVSINMSFAVFYKIIIVHSLPSITSIMHSNILIAVLNIAFSTVQADDAHKPPTKEQLAEAYPSSEPGTNNYFPTSLFGFEYVAPISSSILFADFDPTIC